MKTVTNMPQTSNTTPINNVTFFFIATPFSCVQLFQAEIQRKKLKLMKECLRWTDNYYYKHDTKNKSFGSDQRQTVCCIRNLAYGNETEPQQLHRKQFHRRKRPSAIMGIALYYSEKRYSKPSCRTFSGNSFLNGIKKHIFISVFHLQATHTSTTIIREENLHAHETD